MQLLELPQEILESIFSFIGSAGDLREAACVCSRFNLLSEPRLYEDATILRGDTGVAFCRSLEAREVRATWVKDLLVSPPFEHDAGLAPFPPLLCKMRNLKRLRLETPDCNARLPEERTVWVALQERYERIFQLSSAAVPDLAQRYLPRLESCTLHFVDSKTPIYGLSKYATLFLHPTLRSLTISCAATDWPNDLLRGFQNDPHLLKSTALEYLHLEECDIYAPSLAILLSFPKALKSLVISEGVRYSDWGGRTERPSRRHGNVNPDELVKALASQRDSLESLSLNLGHFRPHHQSIDNPGQHLDLTTLPNVKDLEMNYLTSRLVITAPECDHNTWKRLPPSLEKLSITGIPLTDRRVPFRVSALARLPLEHCALKHRKAHGLQNLTQLVYSYTYQPNDLSFLDDHVRRAIERQPVLARENLKVYAERALPTLKKSGVALRLTVVTLPAGFIPPYLHREGTPTEFVLWDSRCELGTG